MADQNAVQQFAGALSQLHESLNTTVGAFKMLNMAVSTPAAAGGNVAQITAERDDFKAKHAAALSKIAMLEVELFEKEMEIEALRADGAAPPAAASANVSAYGGVAMGDSKDTETFKYFTYPKMPKFTDKHKSLMAKTLTPELWEKMKDLKTAGGYTFHNAIQTGVETPHLGVGCTAGDEEAWTLFGDLYNPVIKGWHGYDPETGTHPTDLDFDKVVFTAENQALFNKYVKSTRIRAARNITGYGLPAGATDADRAAVEGVLKNAFAGFKGDLKGTYFPLGGMSAEQEEDLQSQGFLFQKPKTTNLLTYAGAARNWPASRGIFHNDSKTALCWCNEEDHCRIISMSKDGDVKAVFARFCEISLALAKSAQDNGDRLMHSEKLGFLGTCPSNLGTGMRGSVMIHLPELNKDVHRLEEICAAFDLQPRGSDGEHSAAKGAMWDVSNKQRLGFSEVQLVQKMVNGVLKLIAIEQKLAAGGTITEADLSTAETPKAATKRALLTGLRNGKLEKAVDKMEADEDAAAQEKAAATVQRHVRGHAARQEVGEKLALELAALEEQTSALPAATAPGDETPRKKKKSKKAYYTSDGERVGPVSMDEFMELIRAGAILSSTHVWTKGMGEWLMLGDGIASFPEDVAEVMKDHSVPAPLHELQHTKADLEEFLECDPGNAKFQTLLEEITAEIADHADSN